MDINWSKAPEGTTHWVGGTHPWHRHVDGKALFWAWGEWRDLPGWLATVGELYAKSIQARPVAPWNGDGLPPVGTVCEWSHTDGIPWTGPVEVLFLSKHTVLLRHPGNGDTEGAYSPGDCQFRPLRTAEQIAKEEREEAVHQMGVDAGFSTDPQSAYKRLYDAGYRKVQQ